MSFKIKGDSSELLSALEPAARFVSHHGSNAPVQHVHIVLGQDSSYVQATDLRMSYRKDMVPQLTQQDVDVLVNPRIVKAVKAMRAGEVNLEHDGNGTLTITGTGKSVYTVPTAAGEFPNPFTDWDKVDWGTVPAIDAKEVIDEMQAAAKFVAKGETNPSITGVNLRVKDGKLAIDSTDGYRLFQSTVDLPHEGFPFGEDQVIIPLGMINELGRLFPTGEVKLGSTDNLFFATNPQGDVRFSCRRIGGKFPDADKLLPEFNNKVKLPRPELNEALNKLRSVADPKKPVTWDIKEDELVLTARGDDGTAEEYVELLEKNPEPIVMGFNLEHIASGVQLFDGDSVDYSFVVPMRPALLSDGTHRRFLCIPVRLT